MSDDGLASAVLGIAETLRTASTGVLADLRRMDGGGESKPPAFWSLAAKYPRTVGNARREGEWASIVCAMAILTPRGAPEGKPRLHKAVKRFGGVLCDGGDATWPHGSKDAKPFFSEQRLAQLLAAQGAARSCLLMRAIRSLSRRMPADGGVNLIDIAKTFLVRDAAKYGRLLAKPYYARLVAAQNPKPTIEGSS